MKIFRTPIYTDRRVDVVKVGEVLTINGVELDFSPLKEGSCLPARATGCEFLVGKVSREDGELTLTLIVPTGLEIIRGELPPISPADGEVNLYEGLEESWDD